MYLTRSTESKGCEQFDIYGHTELASFLNFYFHWSSLVLQNGNGTGIFLHSRQGVMQGDPLDFITYVIGILPLIKISKRSILTPFIPDMLTTPKHWLRLPIIKAHFNSLK